MRGFLQRISSRKFLTALAVQLAGVLALFWPSRQDALNSAAVQIAALATMLLAALGYGAIEAAVDRKTAGTADNGPLGPVSAKSADDVP